MPMMMRSDKKATKIIFKILGTPANLVKHRESARDRKVNAMLIADETRLAR